MSLFAMALIYRDGLLVALGALATLASIALLSLSIGAAWMALVLLVHQFGSADVLPVYPALVVLVTVHK